MSDDMLALHDRVKAALEQPRTDELQAVGRDSLLAAYNSIAEPSLRIDQSPEMT